MNVPNDKTQDIESRTQSFCDVLFSTVEFAINSGIIKPEFKGVRQEGEKKFKAGVRKLLPIIDQSHLYEEAFAGLSEIITGGALLILGTVYTTNTMDIGFRKGTSAAGIISGKIRKAEAEEGWRPYGLKLAITIRKEDKGITQADLAGKMKLRWKLKLKCPVTQLVQAISQWEREGKLPRRHK